MVKFRRKSCIPVFAVLLLVLIVTVVLKNLAPDDTSPVNMAQPAERSSEHHIEKDDKAQGKPVQIKESAQPVRDRSTTGGNTEEIPST